MKFALSDMQLKSDAFAPGGVIPRKYTGEGADISPALSWSGAPPATKSYALVCYDPDAPLLADGACGFTHWLLYNVPASVSELSEGCDDFTSGLNHFDKQAYGGPMPPEGHGTHRYFFWLLALDKDLELPPGLTMKELLSAVEPSMLAMNRLVGTYERK
ncbi:MAG: YbhB/YbcL family Raf kinase inhibitor-like protein [Halioglobus sp.]|nr:YbhB/YbcL family Raf kinase inhibitor-like protein [Halioglobus sp.]